MAERDDKGRFIKGHERKGGRKEGTPNFVNKQLRQLLRDFSVESYETFVKMAYQCEPKDFCKIWLDAAKINIPMLQSISIEASDEMKETIEQKLLLMSKSELDKD